MILGGDEFCRTQLGNNNAYCQDNEISWYDWTFLEKNREIFEFVRNMIAFRARHPTLSSERFYRPEDVSWFNPSGHVPDWHSESAVGCRIYAEKDGGQDLCLLCNPLTYATSFVIPEPPHDSVWLKVIDTGAEPPFDICPPGQGLPFSGNSSTRIEERSMVVLLAERNPIRA